MWDRLVFDLRKHVAEISECQITAVQVLDDILRQVETRFIIVGVARALNARNPVSLQQLLSDIPLDVLLRLEHSLFRLDSEHTVPIWVA